MKLEALKDLAQKGLAPRGKSAELPSTFVAARRGLSTLRQFAVRLRKDEQGQDLVEYALIVAAVGLALITTVNTLSGAIVSLYSSITQGLASIGTSGQ